MLILLLLIILFCETIDAGPTTRRRRLPPIIRIKKICRRSADATRNCIETEIEYREEIITIQ